MLRECSVIQRWPKDVEHWWFQTLLVPSQTCSEALEEVADVFIIGRQIDGPGIVLHWTGPLDSDDLERLMTEPNDADICSRCQGTIL